MNYGKLAAAPLGSGVVMLLLGGLWHMSIMSTFYDENSVAAPLPEPKMQFIVLAAN